MQKILAIHGLLGSGKDTTISIIKAVIFLFEKYKNSNTDDFNISISDVEKLIEQAIIEKDNQNWLNNELGIRIERFAYPLKTLIIGLLGCSMDELNSQEFKKTILPEEIFYSPKMDKVFSIRDLHTDVSDSLKTLINKEMFATTCFYRCKKLFENNNDIKLIIINDLRYEDIELPLCILNKCYLIKILRDNNLNQIEKSNNIHSSELGIPSNNFDYIIKNDFSYFDLFKKIMSALVDAGIITYKFKSILDKSIGNI